MEKGKKQKKSKEAEKNKEIEEYKDKYFRALADLDNYRKRAAIEREEIITFANEALVVAMLPIIDSFDRAMDSSRKSGSTEEVIKGVALIKRQLEDTLNRAGVIIIDAAGKKFDPNLHEAVMKRKSPDHDEDTVLEVMQKGFTLHGKVIRPAMVIISEK